MTRSGQELSEHRNLAFALVNSKNVDGLEGNHVVDEDGLLLLYAPCSSDNVMDKCPRPTLIL
jgi:hypothetical protein